MKWEHLKNYKFKLPSLEKQKKLAELFWSINHSRNAYQKLLQETDELIKSQFIEMFGSIENNKYNLPKNTIGSFAAVKGGKRLPKGAQYADEPTVHPYIRVIDMLKRTVKMDDLKYLDEKTQKAISRYIINKNDVYISIAGTIGQVGMIPECLDGANLIENAAKIVFKDNALFYQNILFGI